MTIPCRKRKNCICPLTSCPKACQSSAPKVFVLLAWALTKASVSCNNHGVIPPEALRAKVNKWGKVFIKGDEMPGDAIRFTFS